MSVQTEEEREKRFGRKSFFLAPSPTYINSTSRINKYKIHEVYEVDIDIIIYYHSFFKLSTNSMML